MPGIRDMNPYHTALQLRYERRQAQTLNERISQVQHVLEARAGRKLTPTELEQVISGASRDLARRSTL